MKRIACLFMCLLVAVSLLAFASCNDNSTSGSSSSTQSSKIEGSGEAIGGTSDVTGSVDGADESDVTGSVDGADESDVTGSVDSSDKNEGDTTDSSADSSVESGSSDEGTDKSDISSGSEGDTGDNGGDDGKEKVTISFVCFMYEPVSGSKEVKIDKGSAILLSQMPVFERKGYVLVWSYDMFGDEKWQPTDVFNEDTELFGTWVEVNLFDELREKLSILTNFQMDSAITSETIAGEQSHTIVTKHDGTKVYTVISAGDLTEESWYVDGICYFKIGESIMKQEVTEEEKEELFGDTAVGENAFFGVERALVRSINKEDSKEGTIYTIVIDEAKYTDSLPSDMPVELVYSSIDYQFTLDESGTLISVVSEYSYTENGNQVDGKSVSQIINIGSTVVEAPVVD